MARVVCHDTFSGGMVSGTGRAGIRRIWRFARISYLGRKRRHNVRWLVWPCCQPNAGRIRRSQGDLGRGCPGNSSLDLRRGRRYRRAIMGNAAASSSASEALGPSLQRPAEEPPWPVLPSLLLRICAGLLVLPGFYVAFLEWAVGGVYRPESNDGFPAPFGNTQFYLAAAAAIATVIASLFCFVYASTKEYPRATCTSILVAVALGVTWRVLVTKYCPGC